ncbi:MAG TPA: S-layer homology domain-containing protein [Candidatus Gracilibacteria bacterium]|nr:S-layer homology domain-containing protein [Candidatus Gracilibacteria bacterium]
MKKFTLKLFLSFSALLFSIFIISGTALAAVFSDVPDDHEYITAIKYLKSKSYINGYSDSTYKPEISINRAEAVKIIVASLGLNITANFSDSFKDVKTTDWFYPYVMAAKKAGIVTGDGAGTFRPTDTISLAETLAILCRAYGVDVPKLSDSDTAPFSDVKATDWFAGYAKFAKDKSIVMMDDNGRADISSALNRGRFSDLMYRFLIVKESNWKEFPFYESWTNYESDVLPFEVKYPQNWQILKYLFDEGEGVSFWKSDSGYFQSFPERVYPNTAKFVVALDSNPEGLNQFQYFSNIKTIFPDADFDEVKVGNFSALRVSYENDYIVDQYVYINTGDFDKKVLTIYTQNGTGILAEQNRKFLDALLKTLNYRAVKISDGKDYTSIKSNIFKNVLVEGKGKDLIDSLPDKVIIFTDAIGVGTGPIDYYYSSTLGLTLKYERAGDVILDYRESQTTSF